MGDKCPPAGAPGWMVTFADLMALLLTLFVLMLTFAEMDIVKWKQLAGSMAEAFGTSKKDKLSGMIELDGTMQRRAAASVDLSKRPEEVKETSQLDEPDAETPEQRNAKRREQEMENLQGAVRQAIADEIAGSGMTVERSGNAVVIRFPSEIAFASGSDVLNDEFRATLSKLLPVLQKTHGNIIVSGHTDNIPLSGGGKFQSNWDLSASRATAVVHWFLDHEGMEAERMTVQGFGDSRPLTTNDTPEGRAKNRRVEVSIVQGADVPGAPAGPGEAPEAETPAGPALMQNPPSITAPPSLQAPVPAPAPAFTPEPAPAFTPEPEPMPAPKITRTPGGGASILLPPAPTR